MYKLICPKCKNKVESNELRCNVCGLRLQVVCPNCDTLNNFGNTICSGCGSVLLKYCSHCGSANLSDAVTCRKCNHTLENSQVEVKKHDLVKFIETEETGRNSVSFESKSDEHIKPDIKNYTADFIKADEKTAPNDISVTFSDKTDKYNVNNQNDDEYDFEYITQPDDNENVQFTDNLGMTAETAQLNAPEYVTRPDTTGNVQFTDNLGMTGEIAQLNAPEYVTRPDVTGNVQFTDNLGMTGEIAQLNAPEYVTRPDTTGNVQFTDNLGMTAETAQLNGPEYVTRPDITGNVQFTDNLGMTGEIAQLNAPEYVSQSDGAANLQLTDEINFSGDINPLNDADYLTQTDSNANLQFSDELNLMNDLNTLNEVQTDNKADTSYDIQYFNKDDEGNEVQYVDETIKSDDAVQSYSQNTNYESQYNAQQTVETGYNYQNTDEYGSDYNNQAAAPEFIQDNKTVNLQYSDGTNTGIFEFSDAQDMLNMLTQVFEQPKKMILAVCGEEGSGKTTVVNAFLDSLAQKQIIPLKSECSELTKITPYGAVRDAVLKLLSFPDFHPNMQSYMSEQSKELFASNFSTLDQQEIQDFMNFLYPSVNGEYKDIYDNKLNTYSILEKVFKSISVKNNFVFVIDNYDFIDSSSYDFINYMIKYNKINNKFIIIYNGKENARGYFSDELAERDIFATFAINNMDESKSLKLVQNFANTSEIPREILDVINKNGKGNIFFAEQYLALLFGMGYLVSSQNVMFFSADVPLPKAPENIEELLKLRLNELKNTELKTNLYIVSVLGYKFDVNFFMNLMEYTPEQTENILNQLADLMYISKSGYYDYSFKNITTRNVIFEEAQKMPNFKEICKKIVSLTERYGLANPAVQAEISQYTDDTDVTSRAWKNCAQLAANLGDEQLYTDSYEKWLTAVGYSYKSEQINDAQLKVLESLGKIYSFENPEKAVKYLTDSITAAGRLGNFPKMIELSAYMIKACNLAGDYNGVLETVDMVISSEAALQPFEKAVILSKKMNSLFTLGNCEAAINLANNDLLPVFEEELSKTDDYERIEKLFDMWFDVSITLANTYSLQGNIQSFNKIANIEETLKMNNIQKTEYTTRINLSKAFAKAVTGSVSDCFRLLNDIPKNNLAGDNRLKVQYNLILAFAKVLSGGSDEICQKLSEYIKSSDASSDKFSSHMFKLMSAVLLFNSKDYQKSIEIFNEELNFFAKEQIVTGAIVSWLYIARINLINGNVDSALNIADKALEIAQNPRFSQYHAAIYLQELISEINMIKGDAEAAQMYIEKAITAAKQSGLEYAKIELYRAYIKLLEQLMELPDTHKVETINKIKQIFNTSFSAVQTIKFPGLYEQIQKDYNEFSEYCSQHSFVAD